MKKVKRVVVAVFYFMFLLLTVSVVATFFVIAVLAVVFICYFLVLVFVPVVGCIAHIFTSKNVFKEIANSIK